MCDFLISNPIPLISKRQVEINVEKMSAKAKKVGAVFRPHMKTHQSLRIAKWIRECGVDKITVSSPTMALQFASDGWNDIVIAFPSQIGAINIYNQLLEMNIKYIKKLFVIWSCKLTPRSQHRLGLITDNVESIELIDKNLKGNVSIWIDLDCGYGRTGVGKLNGAVGGENLVH
jgi:D-serine deaminase-like pyridoxal phosphate-dependent protein